MSDSLLYRSTDELAAMFDDPDELWDRLEDEVTELPPKYQDLEREEVLELEATQMTEDEARKVAAWTIERRQAAGVYKKTKEKMDDE